MSDRDRQRSTASQRASTRTAQRRNELRAEAARLHEERQNLGSARTRAETWALTAAAVVGAISLSVTAWGTYWTARVAEDQLQQSKEQDEDKAKAQAARVTYWLEQPTSEDPRKVRGSGNRLVIVNRSLDPVTNVSFIYEVHEPVPHGSPDTAGLMAWGFSSISTFPPCSKTIVRSVDLSLTDGKPVPTKAWLQIAEMVFVDAQGRGWHRGNEGSQLVKDEAGGFLADVDALSRRLELDRGGLKWTRLKPVDQPVIENSAAWAKPLEECGKSE
ncbi:hypothetical protein BU52_28785 [Streptomyces toyocaensis]|uniref:Uncharacterized protein n=1 Tax=Streptomyces toyocaensis TaxID=55952 RepID=A0A081XJJ5_STRTO|nr:hypothetical protein [Streptomyces toyocaensis]KES03718.1 hypothetical protein BU52_28785 [Streptomyces toyocaensis]